MTDVAAIKLQFNFRADRRLGASSLDSLEFRNEVCVLGWPPSFLAVPHYIILAQLSVRTLSEPDVPC